MRIKLREEPSSLPAKQQLSQKENPRIWGRSKKSKSDHLRLCSLSSSSSEPPANFLRLEAWAPLSKVHIQCAHTCTICMCFLHKTSAFVSAISCIASVLQCYQLRHSYKIVVAKPPSPGPSRICHLDSRHAQSHLCTLYFENILKCLRGAGKDFSLQTSCRWAGLALWVGARANTLLWPAVRGLPGCARSSYRSWPFCSLVPTVRKVSGRARYFPVVWPSSILLRLPRQPLRGHIPTSLQAGKYPAIWW